MLTPKSVNTVAGITTGPTLVSSWLSGGIIGVSGIIKPSVPNVNTLEF